MDARRHNLALFPKPTPGQLATWRATLAQAEERIRRAALVRFHYERVYKRGDR